MRCDIIRRMQNLCKNWVAILHGTDAAHHVFMASIETNVVTVNDSTIRMALDDN